MSRKGKQKTGQKESIFHASPDRGAAFEIHPEVYGPVRVAGTLLGQCYSVTPLGVTYICLICQSLIAFSQFPFLLKNMIDCFLIIFLFQTVFSVVFKHHREKHKKLKKKIPPDVYLLKDEKSKIPFVGPKMHSPKKFIFLFKTT